VPFTVKDWRDFPDTTTPITAAALEDMEGRGGTWKVVRTAAELTTAISAANTVGYGAIALMPGNYDFTGEQNWSYSNIHYWSIVPRAAVLRLTASSGAGWGPMISVSASSGAGASISNVTFEGIVFDANSQATSPALRLAGVYNARLINCQFKNCADPYGIGCVYVQGGNGNGGNYRKTSRVLFDRCEIGPNAVSTNQAPGLTFFGGLGETNYEVFVEDVKLRDCYVHDNNHNGVQAYMYNKCGIAQVTVEGGLFENNALAMPATGNTGHLIDNNRTGWVDLLVHGNAKFRKGHPSCGAVADHHGRNVRILECSFKMGAVTYGFDQWTIAIGEARTEPNTDRSWDVEVAHCHFEDCGAWDFDSSKRTWVHHNTFKRNLGRPLGMFGHHFYTRIEDNKFIENGQGFDSYITNATSGVQEDYARSGASGALGIQYRRNEFRDDQTARAMLTTNFTGATNNDLIFIAREGGTAANSYRVAFVNAGASQTLSVAKAGNDITINVGTNGGGTVTSTAAQVQAVVNEEPDINTLLYANFAPGNTGTGVVGTMALTNLAGGSTTVDPTQIYGIWEIESDAQTETPTQPPILYEDNDFTNTLTPIANMQASYNRVMGPLSVRHFGAVGDGTTDDTASFDRAFALATAGGTIVAPKGIYVVADVAFTADGQTLRGEGGAYLAGVATGTVLKAKSTATYAVKLQGKRECGLENLAIDGNAYTKHGLLYEATSGAGAQMLALDRVMFFRCNRALHIGPGAGGVNQADKNTFSDCRFVECNYGIYNEAINSQDTVLINGNFGSTYVTSIYLDEGCVRMIGGQFQGYGPLIVGNTTSGSPNITSAVAITGAPAATNGQTIAGPGIPTGTTISSGAGTGTVVMSANATATATGIIVGAGGTKGIEIQGSNVGMVALEEVIFEGPDYDVYGGSGFWPNYGLITEQVTFQGPALNVLVNRTDARMIARQCAFNADFDPPTTANGFVSWNQVGGHLILEQCDYAPPSVTGASLPIVEGGGLPYATVASAATITIPYGTKVVNVTGSTTITSITANQTHAGRVVILKWASGATFDMTDGSNLKLAASITTADADDAVTLVCDGTNWHQASPLSVN
jgi:hypothetical protein